MFWIDITLVGLGGLSGALAAGLSTDAANQYISGHWLFWMRITSAAISTTCTTLLGYLKAYGKDGGGVQEKVKPTA